jgi:hypothetical protein
MISSQTCVICKQSTLDKGKCCRVAKLWNRSRIYVHYDCRKEYNQVYFRGIPMSELRNMTCEACGTPFDRKTFKINNYRRITHNSCLAVKCGSCEKMIAKDPYCEYYGTYSCSKPKKTFDTHIIHNRCIYKFKDTPISKSLLSLDDFWPDICNKLTFRYFPREFKLMATEFMLVLLRLRLRYTLNTDTLFMILNYCNIPAYYNYHNGFDVGELCQSCKEPLSITRLDLNICSPGKCKFNKDAVKPVKTNTFWPWSF